MRAEQTMAVVVAPPSGLRPQPIPPSADWRIDLDKGCTAHCQYCYLAGSPAGPPITRYRARAATSPPSPESILLDGDAELVT